MFDSVAPRYDLMNDVMSGGLHRLWKRFTIAKTGLRPGQSALDVAAGSGDLSIGLARQVGRTGRVVVTDINANMLAEGRNRMLDAGHAGNVEYVLADAESLPFADSSFHCVTIGFGLRNVTDKDKALGKLYRVLKPGGRLLVLEFSKATWARSRRSTSFTRCTCCRGSASCSRTIPRASRSRGIDPPPSRSRDAERHDGTRGARALRVLQPHGRGRGAARRLPALASIR